MRRLTTIGVVVALAAGLAWVVTPAPDPAEAAVVISSFTDDDWSVHEADINGLAASGITKGCNPPANTRFCPGSVVTRGQMAAFLVRAFDLPSAPSGKFRDTGGHTFERDIDRLAAAGITLGCNPPVNDRFCPNGDITRAQMASFLTRALELEPRDSGRFRDISGNVHARDINAIAAAGVTIGCNPPTNDRFCPRNKVTREQMASFLVRSVDGVEPILSRVAMRPGSWCAKDRRRCSATLTIPAGRSFEIREGWYQTLPYQPGEQAQFTSSATRFNLTRNGSAVSTTSRSSESSARATREWTAAIGGLSRGTHTFQGVWRWDGNPDLIVTLVVNAR